MIYYLISLLLFVSTYAVQADSAFPLSCKRIPVTEETAEVGSDERSVFLIHNFSPVSLWLTHAAGDTLPRLTASSRLDAGQWSAVLLGKERIELSCIESKPGHEQQIPCATAMSICKWHALGVPAESKGAFWVVENMNLRKLKGLLAENGFIAKTAEEKTPEKKSRKG